MSVPATAPNRFILASASPRRQQLLRQAGFEFLLHPADLDEDQLGGDLPPLDLAPHLAIAKAQSVATNFPENVVLAADTVVALSDESIGKPRDAQHAREILNRLSGTIHSVITGVAVVHHHRRLLLCEKVISTVEMRRLTRAEIDDYIAGNQWQGKAGAYGIQDNDPFVVRLDGCLTNIVGLPMTTATLLLKKAGIEPVLKTFERPPA